MSAQEIIVKMTDMNNGQEVERRIDISNFSVPDYSAPKGWECNKIETDPKRQEEILEQWIAARANEQHETILLLNDWTII